MKELIYKEIDYKNMYFKITHSTIYNWKGSGTGNEQINRHLPDSFCHLIIALEATVEMTWLLLVDQGDDSGVATTNCVEYIIPMICEDFGLELSNLRAFEVWPNQMENSKLKYTEIVISGQTINESSDRVLLNSWKPADEGDVRILDQLIKTVGDKVIRE